MLESFIYKNHLGETIDFGKDGIFVNKNDLHDYSWSYSTVKSKISSFNKAVETRSIPVIISCSSEEEGIQKRNKLFEIVEKDVLAVQYGQIIIGDYYLKCYITKSKKQDYLSTKNYMKVTLTVATDYPFWIREVTTQFWKLGSEHETESDGVEYPYDYPFDYGSETKIRRITNEGFAAANVKLIIYGLCENPYVIIGGHRYSVNVSVQENEHLIIDSYEKTVTLVQVDGTQVNCFNKRDRDNYIFEKVPSGNSNVSWDGSFGFDVILLEERSEPKWT